MYSRFIILTWTLLSLDLVDCQICTKREVFTTMVLEKYLRTYVMTYKGCWSLCTRTKISKMLDFRTVEKKNEEIREECCDGYTDVSEYSWSVKCKPICMPTCINSKCLSPGQCTCDEGYVVDAMRNHVCTPVCSNGCENGICVAPNKCQCRSGYIDFNNTCQPFCLEPCDNGICVAPDICECLPGYRKSEENICKPYCFSGCPNGICKAPDECQCKNGYRQIYGTCQPICKESCNNGICIAPDVCECLPGHGKSENHFCEPLCSSGCPNGTCVQPDVCNCNFGWIKNENDSCVPDCKKSCGNGTCVAPGTCECFTGYEITINDNDTFSSTVCVPSCNNCVNGKCVRPDVCNCNFGWIKNENDSCVPECKKSCGNGTCVAPGTCECFTGYEVATNDNDTFHSTICVPSCNNCVNGTCTAPYECTCEPPLVAKKLLSKCANLSIACDQTLCTVDLTTTIPSSTVALTTDQTESYNEIHYTSSAISWTVRTTDVDNLDNASEEVSTIAIERNTETTYAVDTTSETKLINKENIDYNDPIVKNISNESNKNLKMTFKESPHFWIYIGVPVLVLIAIFLIVSILKRHSIAKWVKGESYVVRDDKFKDDPASIRTEDMSYQKILRKKKNEYY